MNPEGYYDLHLHILPGIDDGARSLEASLEMARGLADAGFCRLVGTPHADDSRHPYGRDRISTLHAQTQAAIEAAGIPISLDYGAEYAYGGRLHEDLAAREIITIAGSRYMLLELPETFIPASMATTLFEIGAAGYYPVLAHPERCKPFHDNPERLARLASGRAVIQVSFRSLAGTFGRTIKKTAWHLVTHEMADLVATDCHSPRELKKIVRPVMKALEKRLDPNQFDRLMRRFPARMLEGAHH